MLWSIAAGPLVNVVLAPLLVGLYLLAVNLGWSDAMPNSYILIRNVCILNCVILVFNLLPIYPLDGGQILHSLLWFVLGRARSLMVTTIIGFIGVAGLILLALVMHSVWTGIMAAFILMSCWRGLLAAQRLGQIAKLPRRTGFACPACRQPPVLGPLWRCAQCLNAFDTFETAAACPHCGAQYPVTQCLDCGQAHPFPEWTRYPPMP